MIHDTFTGSKIIFMSIGTLLVVQICFAKWQISSKLWWIQQQHVQVARMLAFVLWDSIGKRFGRLPNFWHVLKQYNNFRLTRKMRGCSLLSKSENLDLKLQFHFAFCMLQVAFFKNCRWQKHTYPNAFTKSNCNCDMSVNLKSACTYQPWFAFHVSIQCLIKDTTWWERRRAAVRQTLNYKVHMSMRSIVNNVPSCAIPCNNCRHCQVLSENGCEMHISRRTWKQPHF